MCAYVYITPSVRIIIILPLDTESRIEYGWEIIMFYNLYKYTACLPSTAISFCSFVSMSNASMKDHHTCLQNKLVSTLFPFYQCELLFTCSKNNVNESTYIAYTAQKS